MPTQYVFVVADETEDNSVSQRDFQVHVDYLLTSKLLLAFSKTPVNLVAADSAIQLVVEENQSTKLSADKEKFLASSVDALNLGGGNRYHGLRSLAKPEVVAELGFTQNPVVNTIADLLQWSGDELKKVNGLSADTLLKLRIDLRRHGCYLRKDEFWKIPRRTSVRCVLTIPEDSLSLLWRKGFNTLSDLSYVSVHELVRIGVPENLALHIQRDLHSVVLIFETKNYSKNPPKPTKVGFLHTKPYAYSNE